MLVLAALAAVCGGIPRQPRSAPPAAFDCEWRKHAFAFARATLPERGEFATAYNALQLARCGVPPPTTTDTFTPPRLPTPPGQNWFVDPAAAPGGDGSLAAPFATIEQAVAAATTDSDRGATSRAVLLRAGIHRTAGVVLTPAHSGLTIQNYNGEAAVRGFRFLFFPSPIFLPSVLNSAQLHSWSHLASSMILLLPTSCFHSNHSSGILEFYNNC